MMNILFIIKNKQTKADVYERLASDTPSLKVKEAMTEDSSQQAQLGAAEQFKVQGLRKIHTSN